MFAWVPDIIERNNLGGYQEVRSCCRLSSIKGFDQSIYIYIGISHRLNTAYSLALVIKDGIKVVQCSDSTPVLMGKNTVYQSV